MKKIWGLFLTSVICIHQSSAQLQKDICENTIPVGWKAQNGKLELSQQHYKLGKQSVKWNWTSGDHSNLTITDKEFSKVADDNRSTFVFWIYNEKPVNEKISFVFYSGEKENSRFDFNLNFKGWRTAWVMYHRDMQGKPENSMNRLEVKAPKNIKNGTLYFDQVMYNVNINPRSPMRDFQVPYVNPEGDKAANAHWNSLYKFATTAGYLPLKDVVTAEDKKEVATIYNRYIASVLPKEKLVTDSVLSRIQKEYDFWAIKRNKNVITGNPIFSTNDIELFSNSKENTKKINANVNINRYTQLMFDVAQTYYFATNAKHKAKLGEWYINLLDNADEQGWAYGSGMGALHHHGYNLAGFYSSALIMKDLIKSKGKLERTFKNMFWFSGLGRTLELPENMPVSNIDVFNTLLGPMLSTILIMDDSPEKLRYLQYYSKWMSQNISPNLEITGAFKPDGAVFHHGTLYPAYGVGGYNGLAPIIYVLSKTHFKVDTTAHQQFKDNMLMMHYYTNPLKWPISVSGRHPTGTWRIPDMPFAYMALAGTPDGKESIDSQMAAVYLLVSKNKNTEWAQLFKNQNIKPAIYPEGHWNLNFGLLGIHRRNNWLLTVKGHNRYFVSHEAYPNANVFGRYLSYGALEVLFPETKNTTGSAFKDKGWDWNRIPGTTTLHVPLDILRANILNVDDYSGVEEMLLTDEIFAGGTQLNKDGIFAMKLRGHDKYDLGSFRAIKSWFMFDDLVVCLGSDINNDIKDYPTETTVFQNYLNTTNETISWDGNATSFPYTLNKKLGNNAVVTDNRNITYYIPSGQNVVLSKGKQNSRDQKDQVNTNGNFATLILNHGFAPKNASYEYAMLIGSNADKALLFKNNMQAKAPVYKVLEKTKDLHSVKYVPTNIVGMAIYNSNKSLTDDVVLQNSKPCLIMYKQQENKLELSLTDPDLGFYEGEDETPLTPDGKRKEVSIYSRYWFKTPAKPSVIQIKLKGNWAKVKDSGDYTIESNKDGKTLINVNCKYGLATTLSLVKI